MKEERFSAFRLHKEHKGIIFLFGIFALLFSAFYLSLLVDWKPKGAAELGKFAACVGPGFFTHMCVSAEVGTVE